ncbi:MAG: sodium-dependent transporter [Abditibacteriota bacterium]|nr:sodium-dependent transporter [Abditibacteriota bacterium]MBP5737599.1 sodium-dependent transporter [Abditibacteriota bacterium]
MQRANWKNRTTFILAAIGSAVGLGNAWRFPGIAYQNGGGAFLVPYFIAMLTAGIPILALELTLGRKFRKGAPGAFAGLNKKFEWIGWLATVTAFCITAYYSVVFAWVIVYLLLSFKAPWTTADASDLFLNDVLRISSGPFDFSGGISPMVIVGALIGWVCIWLCIRKGVHSVGSVVKYTVVLPVVFLVILVIRACTLQNAMEGLSLYLVPKWAELAKPQIWAAAYGQVFYSMSIFMCIMIAYGSYLSKENDIPKDSLVIGIADAAVSFMAGLSAFGVLGYLSYLTSTPIAEMKHTGMMLAFVTYPTALAKMPGGHWSVVFFSVCFFLVLFTLAIDSVFSLAEGIITGVSDKFGLDKYKATLWACSTLFVCSLFYTLTPGLYWLDIVDHFINDLNLITVGLAECIAVGWIYGSGKMLNMINEDSKMPFGNWWRVCIKFVCPAAFLYIIGGFLYENVKIHYEGYDNLSLGIAGWGLVALTIVVSVILSVLKDGKSAEE